MEEKDYIKDLFSEKLGNHSAQVNPELWTSISSKIATNTVVSSGISLTTKLLLGLGTAASITVATVFLTNDTKEKLTKITKIEKEKKSGSHVKNNSKSDNISEVEEVKSINFENSILTEKTKVHLDCELPDNFEKGDLNNDFSETKLPIENKIITEDISEKDVIVEKISKEISDQTKSITETKSEVIVGNLPNIFTPNNDKENDLFSIELKGLTDFSITILNNENKVVFKSNDLNFKWDGKDFSENLVPVGSYIYFLTGFDSQQKVVSKSSVLKVQY